jgi:hypothetical protein
MDSYDLRTSPNEIPILPYNQGLPLSVPSFDNTDRSAETGAIFCRTSLLHNHKLFGLNSSCEDLDLSSSVEEIEILDYKASYNHEERKTDVMI